MRYKALIDLRLERSICENAFARHVEIGFRLRVRHEHVLGIANRRAAGGLAVEAVVPAIGAGKYASAVTSRKHRRGRVVDHVLRREAYRAKRHDLTGGRFSTIDGIGAGVALEKIIETAVFLHDDDDVFDLHPFVRHG